MLHNSLLIKLFLNLINISNMLYQVGAIFLINTWHVCIRIFLAHNLYHMIHQHCLGIKIWSSIMSRFLSFVILVISVISLVPKIALSEPQVPCYFIFGDSLADPGNNNLLLTQAKVNYPPYGVDFPNAEATGRFCNGQTVVDFISISLSCI